MRYFSLNIFLKKLLKTNLFQPYTHKHLKGVSKIIVDKIHLIPDLNSVSW